MASACARRARPGALLGSPALFPQSFEALATVAADVTTLRADAVAADRVLLRWADAEREGGHLVERRTAGGAFAPVVALGPDATAWLDTTAAPGTTHEWRVTATSPHGDGAQAAVSATTPPAGVLFNGDFEAGDLRGWTRFGPPGARVDTTVFDVDGDGRASWARRARGGLLAPGGRRAAGAPDRRRAGARGVGRRHRGNGAGEVSLVFDGVVLASHDFGSAKREPAAAPHAAAGERPARDGGACTVERGMGASAGTPWQYFDDLRLWGSAVPARPAAPDALAAARSRPACA